ncbi:T9SS C-terminal target domain-containing protein [bacterium]|nr:MAG: T9SS C-terminal target domain-containing protein [bacterium]
MKFLTIALTCLLALVFLTTFAFGEDPDKTPTTRVCRPGVPQEGFQPSIPPSVTVPANLESALKVALESGNAEEAHRIEGLMKAYQVPSLKKAGPADPDLIIGPSTQGAFSQQWLGSDIEVYTGSVKSGGARQIDLKKGEDGDLYLAVNKSNITGFTGRAEVYRSTNGGSNWTVVSGIGSTTAYYGELSMLVETRSMTNNFDSTRIILFYTRSTNSSMQNATVRYISFLRDGTGVVGGSSEIETPAAGSKFGSPSGFSDGAYYTTSTYLGLVAAEYSNDGDSVKALHIYRSTNWGADWTGTVLSTSFQDFYPTAALKPGSGFNGDSVYIAVERRFNATNSLVRVVATKFNPPSSDFMTYYLPAVDGTSRYEKPYINIRQTGREYGTNREVLVTVTKNGQGHYHSLRLDATEWVLDSDLASDVNVEYTYCASDSLSDGSAYFMAAYTDANGDTLGVRRGRPGSLGTRYYYNAHKTSTSVLPACAIYKQGTTQFSAYAYAGFGPTNVYFNQEGLMPVSVKEAPGVPVAFSLGQNYPNPFNPETGVRYQVSGLSDVKLTVYDMLGREVAVLVNEQKPAGFYEVKFDGAGLASGMYIYRLTAGSFVQSRTMLLLK